jgi:glycosyltransferase involved in cell wall biosynthesis
MSIERFADGNPMVFAFNYPQYCSLLKRIPHRLSIYYNTDDYTNHWRGHADDVQGWERDAVYGADITVCIAAYRCGQLKDRFPERADRIHHVPIGCSPGFMVEQPLHEPKLLTGSLSDVRRPVVGYVGALNWRFDYGYLDRVACGLPSVTFALGGKTPERNDGDAAWWRAFEACRHRSNIRFLGPVRHEDVGRWLQSFDALMMMYSDTAVNRCACPAKLWDYLGTSLPIVANDVVPEVARWRDAVYVCKTTEEFSDGLVAALGEDREAHGGRRLAIAREHTWSRLGERMIDIMEARLPGNTH